MASLCISLQRQGIRLQLNILQENQAVHPNGDQLITMSQRETRRSSSEPISDKLPKNLSAILSGISVNPEELGLEKRGEELTENQILNPISEGAG